MSRTVYTVDYKPDISVSR